MIICKEFKNSYRAQSIPSEFFRQCDKMDSKDWLKTLELETKKRNTIVDAVCIDEASMSEPWTPFGKWFVDRYYAGPSMMESIMIAQRGSNHDSLELFRSVVFTQEDFDAVKKQMKETGYDESKNASTILEYLQKCIGNHISTENW